MDDYTKPRSSRQGRDFVHEMLYDFTGLCGGASESFHGVLPARHGYIYKLSGMGTLMGQGLG
jgi:hypothetical protein